jgi:hypothetical protein
VAAAGPAQEFKWQEREVLVKYLHTALAFTVLLVLLPALAAAEAPRTARFTATVKSNTANGAPVVGDEVTLLLYRGQEPIDSLPAQVGPDGKAVWENIPTGPSMAAVARAKHQNMAFTSGPVSLDPARSGFSATVEVFDVSTDTSKLSVGTHHIMVAVRGTALTGAQRDEQNQPVVIRVKLPKGFRDLTESSYLEREALVVTSDGFYDTMAVPPGEHQVTFSYRLDIDRGTMKVAKEITLPTAELMVFWEHGQGKLEGLGEPNDRLVSGEGVPIEYYRRSALKPGDVIAFQISGFHVKESDAYTWLILGAVFVAIMAVVLVRLRPRAGRPGQKHA